MDGGRAVRAQAAAAKIVRPDSRTLTAAAEHLRTGQLVAFPTETVYGLGGDASNQRAVAAIYRAKGRPPANPLIVHAANRSAAERLARFDRRAARLADRFWPGALTLVLPRAEGCGAVERVSAGLATIAVRVPAHPVALALLNGAGVPLAAPSANRSGRVSATTAQHAAENLGADVAMVLDGGACPIGIESTVVGLADGAAVLFRPGAIDREAIETVVGPLDGPGISTRGAAGLPAPGMMDRHYAPSLPLRLEAREVGPGEALLAFGPYPLRGAAAERNLSPNGDLREAAVNLFRMVSELDRPEYRAIAVMPIPDHALGAAINDRLRRAARAVVMPAAAENA